MSTFEKAIVVLINVTLFALGLLALAGLSLLLSGCAHPELPVIPVEPVPITEVILPAHVEGGAWFCVELGHGTVCPWRVREVREMVLRLRAAE